MAGNSRYELNSTSSELGFVGIYPNGQRGNHFGHTLDRSGSFREGTENRIVGSGIGTSRGSGTLLVELPPLPQCLMLDPILMGDQKYTRFGELRRVIGLSIGSTSEDNSFGATHLKSSPALAIEDVKSFKSSVVDTCIKARGRSRKLDEHIYKLNKYCEAITNKKQQRNEVITPERSACLNLKMGIQINQNSPDLVTQKLEDRPKTVLLNKRVRTSVAEARPECLSNGLPRQPLFLAKDRDILKETSADSDAVEKIHRLPASGEGWDKKMKRKRSVGTVLTKSIDSDGDLKRVMHHKLSSEQGLQSCDAHNFRSGATNDTGGIKKFDGTTLPASSITHATPKNEQERATVLRNRIPGLNKERFLSKGSNNNTICPSPVTKGKASRTLHSGSTVATNSTPNIPRIPGTLESWEHTACINKIPATVGANSRKRAMSSGSSSPPMAQWVGQRPQKIRTRRANLVPLVSNHYEIQMSSKGCSPSDVGVRSASNGTDGSLLSRSANNSTQQLRVKLENVQSPARLSESEVSGTGEIRSKEKNIDGGEANEKVRNAIHSVGPSPTPKKKNKFFAKEESGDGVCRQGRSGRDSSSSRACVSPMREKLDRTSTTKPVRSTRPEKNGRKMSDRKGYSHLGHLQNNGSPDFTGEADDDREELLTAANFARNASYLACSSSFWKKMEPIFFSVRVEDKSYLSQQLDQLKLSEELHESQPQIFGHGKYVLGDLVHEETSLSGTLNYGGRNIYPQYQIGKSSCVVKSIDQHQEADTLFGSLNSESRISKVTPLYQRVLSALILEDEIEESEEINVGGNRLFQSVNCNLLYDTRLLVNAEPKRDSIEYESESVVAVQTQCLNFAKRLLSCNGNANSDSSPDIQNPTCNDELFRGSSGFIHSEVDVLTGICRNDLDGIQIGLRNGFDISSLDCRYEQICQNDKLSLELQSVGLYPETVPDLDDREDEVIDQEIVQLKQRLHQQTEKKKMCLENVYKAIRSYLEERNLEQVALDRLVVLAYKKLLGTRGASKGGASKHLKQTALAFGKRTLARCRKFEDSGISCFSEPVFQEIIFSAPPRGNDAEPLTSVGIAVANIKYLETRNRHAGPKSSSGSFRSSADVGSADVLETFTHISDEAFSKSGPISNRGKKKEVLLDDVVGGAVLRATSGLGGTSFGGTKGRRSERDRDKDMSTRNGLAKTVRPSQGSSKGERKMKTKPKQKTSQLLTSGIGIVNKFLEITHPVYPSANSSSELVNTSGNKREVRFISPGNVPQDLSDERKEPMDIIDLPLHELDPIEHQEDFFNFEEDGLEDDFSAGLEIPMDDLSSLNMF